MKKQGKLKRPRRPKRRKRQVINGQLEHAITAKDLRCDEAVQLKAEDHHLGFYRKGHSRNHLYFKCDEKKWNSFYSDIRHLCIVDSPATPAKLQKKMLKNLSAAAYSNIDLARAKTAERLLAAVKRNADKAALQVQVKTEKADGRIRANRQQLKSTPTDDFRIRKSISNALRKCVSSLRTFVSRKKRLLPAHS